MKYFSYNDFMDYKENKKINKIKYIQENEEKYNTKNGTIKNKHEIINILSEKGEMKTFLKEFLNLYEITKINHYENVNLNKEQNIVYKSQDKQLYIFVKVLDEIDNNISYKMFEEALEIIKNWDEKEKNKNLRYPIVIPIVVYTGKIKWKIFEEKQNNKVNYITYKENSIDFSYNIIKINELNINDIKNKNCKIVREIINTKINIYK